MMDIKKKSLIIGTFGLLVYGLSTASSYALFSWVKPALRSELPAMTTSGGSQKPAAKKPDLPRTEECPINGAMYTKPEREAWETRRPLAVMVENSKTARPQSGLSFADVIYEAVAEGGITRFMAVYYCQEAESIGPIRSARTYYLDWASEYGLDPLYVHVGGANTPGPADALGQIEKYGWVAYNDLNQFSIGFPTFWRDYERLGPNTATEHTVYSSTEKLWDFVARKRKLTHLSLDEKTGDEVPWSKTYGPWQFKNDAELADRPENLLAVFNFSNTESVYIDDYIAKWQYDRHINSFLRFSAGTAHNDMVTGQQLVAKNVVLQFTTLTVADDGYTEEGHGAHLLYGTKGKGKATFLVDGKVFAGTWSKKDRTSRTLFFDDKGQEVKFNRGLVWVEILPIGQKVVIE